MNKKSVKFLIISIICFLIIASFPNSISNHLELECNTFYVDVNNTKMQDRTDNVNLLSYDQWITIEIDSDGLNYPLPLEETTIKPIKVKYSTSLPSELFKWMPRIIRNLIIFRRLIEPMQTIHLEAINIPNFASINFTEDEILFPIPRHFDVYEKMTNLTIYLDKNATALMPFQVEIKSYCKKIGVLNNFTGYTSYYFTPQYNPCITIDYEKNIYTPPLKGANTNINITNCGNGESLIRPKLIDFPEDFIFHINPQIVVGIKSSSTLILSVISPQHYSGNSTIQIELSVEFSHTVGTVVPTKDYIIEFNCYYP